MYKSTNLPLLNLPEYIGLEEIKKFSLSALKSDFNILGFLSP